MRAIQISEFGGPEVLVLREVEEPTPEGEEIMIDVEAAGVNWGDTHQAEDSYAAPSPLPLIPGLEVVGTTSDGRRVVALLPDRGGYAEKAASVEPHIHQIPDRMDAHSALAVVLQGATAWHLLRTATHMADGEKVLVHAGAGGRWFARDSASKALGCQHGGGDRIVRGKAADLPRPRSRCRD